MALCGVSEGSFKLPLKNSFNVSPNDVSFGAIHKKDDLPKIKSFVFKYNALL